MTAAAHSMQLPKPLQLEDSDPLLATQVFAHRRLFHPLGFTVEITSNSPEILLAAVESWGEQTLLSSPKTIGATLHVRLGVTSSTTTVCPPATSFRADGHLMSIVANAENFAVCDLQQGFAFGWVNEAALHHRSYLRYHFLEAIVMCLLTGSRVTPIHAACVSLGGRGILLCGESGAGKSTLAYACARAGFTLTTDDASYVVWESDRPVVRGNAYQVRFRPSARDLFPELSDRSLTPRTEGKPSIEVRTRELPGIVRSPEAAIHAILLLRRHHAAPAQLVPLLPEDVLPYLEASLYPMPGIRIRQAEALRPLLDAAMYEFRYCDLTAAIACLTSLIDE